MKIFNIAQGKSLYGLPVAAGMGLRYGDDIDACGAGGGDADEGILKDRAIRRL